MTANDLIYKSIHIITEYYNNNLQPYFDSISEDVLWIGPAERQEIRGREQVISTFSAEVHGLSFTMGWACGHFFRPLCLYSFYNLED